MWEGEWDAEEVFMPKAALFTAAGVFALVSLLHWVRVVMGGALIIGGAAIPVSASVVLGIMTACLAAWMVHAGRKI